MAAGPAAGGVRFVCHCAESDSGAVVCAAKPIDLLAWYVSSEECVDALEMHEPYTYLNGLQTRDLEDLLEDIEVYKELENNANAAYWEDVATIVRDELGKLRRLAAPAAARDGVHRAVADDVARLFRGKSAAQLRALQAQIERKIGARHAGLDVAYWESLLSQLRAHRARARLRDRHRHNLRRKLQLLKQEQGVQPAQPAGHPAEDPGPAPNSRYSRRTPRCVRLRCGTFVLTRTVRSQSPRPQPEQPSTSGGAAAAEASGGDSDDSGSGSEARACEALYLSGRYSPPPLDAAALEPATLLTEAADDEQRLAYLRARLHAANDARRPAPPSAAGAPLERLAARAMGASTDADAPFAGEHALPDQPCLWADKYRPRKPRYFNR